MITSVVAEVIHLGPVELLAVDDELAPEVVEPLPTFTLRGEYPTVRVHSKAALSGGNDG